MVGQGQVLLTGATALKMDSLLEDQRQLNSSSSCATLTLSCDNGALPLHPQLLTTLAPTVRKLLAQQDLSEPCFIHLDGYSLHTLRQLVELIYTGRSTTGDKEEQYELYSLMTTLAIPMAKIMCKKIDHTSTAATPTTLLRMFPKPPQQHHKVDEDKENNSGEPIRVQRPSTRAAGMLIKKMAEKGDVGTTAATTVGVRRRTISGGGGGGGGAAARAKFLVEETECCTCLKRFSTEKGLVMHLNAKCGSNLKDKWNYERRCCLLCQGSHTFKNIWELLSHVEMCGVKGQDTSGGLNGGTSSSEQEVEKPERTEKAKTTTARKRRAASSALGAKRRKMRAARKKDVVKKEEQTDGGGGQEEEKEDENESIQEPAAAQEAANNVEGKKDLQTIDPDLVRKQLGVMTTGDIASLPCDKLSTLFYICPICTKQHHRVTNLTTCLRQHGFRYCWACLKLFPSQGFAFDAHCMMEHCERDEEGEFTSNKVPCPLCHRKFDYKQHLPSHMGSVHSHQLTYGDDVGEHTNNKGAPPVAKKQHKESHSQDLDEESQDMGDEVKVHSQGTDDDHVDEVSQELDGDKVVEVKGQGEELQCHSQEDTHDEVKADNDEEEEKEEEEESLEKREEREGAMELGEEEKEETSPIVTPTPPLVIDPPPEATAPPSVFPPPPPLQSVFPCEYGGGEWKYTSEQVFGGQAYGFYVNRAGKVIGVPACRFANDV